MTERIFEAHDETSGDSIALEIDRGRLLIRSVVENRERLLVLANREDGLRLGRVLLEALQDGNGTSAR